MLAIQRASRASCDDQDISHGRCHSPKFTQLGYARITFPLGVLTPKRMFFHCSFFYRENFQVFGEVERLVQGSPVQLLSDFNNLTFAIFVPSLFWWNIYPILENCLSIPVLLRCNWHMMSHTYLKCAIWYALYMHVPLKSSAHSRQGTDSLSQKFTQAWLSSPHLLFLVALHLQPRQSRVCFLSLCVSLHFLEFYKNGNT